MYLTVLSGSVSSENWSRLEQSYAKAIQRPPEGLLHSFLVHSTDDPRTWQVISIWRDEETFQRCKQAGQVDPCVQMFCDAGDMPERMSYFVSREYTRV